MLILSKVDYLYAILKIMNIIFKIIVAIFFIVLPLLIALLNDIVISDKNPEGLAGLAGILIFALFIPITIVSGTITAFLTRKRDDSFKYYVLGFMIPSFIGCIFVWYAMVNS